MTHDGTNSISFDDNGNMTSDGVNSYTWDRANRLLSHAGTSYAYDGNSNRISQTVSSIVTEYLVDTQPGLTKVIGDSDGNRYVHSLRGIHAMENASGDWLYAGQDSLGSVRAEINASGIVQSKQDYDPFLTPMNAIGTSQMPFGATGEYTDDNDLLYLRARYMSPELGGFLSLDPFEGLYNRPMSLNGYSWVEGNTSNLTDASGMTPSLNEIRNGRIRYSCKCGWIDAAHAAGAVGEAAFLHRSLITRINYGDSSISGIRIIHMVESPVSPKKPFQVDRWVYIPDAIVNVNSLTPIAMGIFMDFEESLEAFQSGANPVISTFWGNPSGFAEEDLPSDLMGFWLWITGRVQVPASGDSHDIADETIMDALHTKCKVLSKEQSENVYNEYVKNGLENAFSSNWQNWWAKPLPFHVNCNEDGCGVCGNDTNWPDAFSQLENSAQRRLGNIQIHPFSNGLPQNGWYQIDKGNGSIPPWLISNVQGLPNVYAYKKQC